MASAAPNWRLQRRIGDCGVELAIAAPNWRLRRRIGDCGAGLATAAPDWRLRRMTWRLRGNSPACHPIPGKIMPAINMDTLRSCRSLARIVRTLAAQKAALNRGQ